MDLTPLLTERDLSALLQRPTSTLQMWRRTGQGPKFVKAGHAVRYRPSDVDQWLSQQTRTDTRAAVQGESA
jgi:predicted DNA-binding transcriptional regulator AlpA